MASKGSKDSPGQERREGKIYRSMSRRDREKRG
jgi:hypothetical protein